MISWSTACPDWANRLVNRQTLTLLPPLFPDTAADALAVFDDLRLVDVSKTATFRGHCRPWLREFVSNIFGAYEESTGIRHITEFFLLISKKNGKSTTAAGIMLTALIKNWRDSAEFIILSPTVEIANNSFKPAADMVRADPELDALLQVQDHIRTITHRQTGATLKVVAADAEAVGGKKAVGVLIDELWLFGKRANAEAMFAEAIGGLASRPEGFVIYLTTQSDEPPAGVFKKKLEYARAVRDGTIDDPAFLPVLYEFPEPMLKGKAYMRTENFYVTNPNLTEDSGDEGSVNNSYLLREMKKAQTGDEETMRLFLAKHLNVEIGLNLRADRWPGAEYWEDQCDPEPVTIDRLLAECEVITGGIDGGGLDDLLGAAAIGRKKNKEIVTIPSHFDEETNEWVEEESREVQKWLCWCYAWAHPSVLRRRMDIAPRLRDFAAAKEMTLAKNVGQDIDELSAIFARIEESGLLYQIGLDPGGLGGILDGLVAAGVPAEKLIGVTQGYKLAAAIKTTERKLAERVLTPGKTGLMNWCVGNAKVKVSGNAIVVTKQVSGTAKIDPLMAVFDAATLMGLNPESQITENDFSAMEIGG
jgi:phage terminase large subunit-like protein